MQVSTAEVTRVLCRACRHCCGHLVQSCPAYRLGTCLSMTSFCSTNLKMGFCRRPPLPTASCQ